MGLLENMVAHGLVKTSGEIKHTARIKTYPDGSQEVMVCNFPVFREAGWELVEDEKRPKKGKKKKKKECDGADRNLETVTEEKEEAEKGQSEDVQRSIRRAKAQLKDLALCTPFKYFLTFTLDQQKIDRYDMVAVTKVMNRWLDNNVRRHGFTYIIVPELHKDGAIHFHGFGNGALKAVDSGTISMHGWKKPRRPRSDAERARWLAAGGHIVYNLPAWTLGFSTAIELYGEYSRAVAYVCKYIGKQAETGKIGGRWYYSGGDLGHPLVRLDDMAVQDAEKVPGAYSFKVNEESEHPLEFVMYHVGGDGTVG